VSVVTATPQVLPAADGEASHVPRHVAIIMDGNGRWAKQRRMPRVSGHKRGVETVRDIVKAAGERGVRWLTLFAFSSENWRRPVEEVRFLMQLFMRALEQEVDRLAENGVHLRIVGDLSAFDPELRALIADAEARTASNDRLMLTVAANYGGRWDLMQAINRLAHTAPERHGQWTEADLEPYLALAHAPPPDLFIRTGGEHRLSNFMLWQLAYTELWFTDALWPDFDALRLDEAFAAYARRERRFGRISEQLHGASLPVGGADPASAPTAAVDLPAS
jgi:undecaprenyl diphosphate synthase